MRAWVGPWVWQDTGAGMAWTMPAGAMSAIDLRADTAMAAVGGAAQGFGLFLTPDVTALGTGYLEIQPTLNAARRTALQSFLSLPESVVALTRPGFMLDLLTRHSKVLGDSFCRPLMPQRNGRLRLQLGDVDLDQPMATDSPYWAKVQIVYQATYRRMRQRVLNGEAMPNLHRKWLGMLMRETYPGWDFTLFIPGDVPVEDPLAPSTTLSDTFNRADAGTLGTASGGFSWTTVAATYGIASNHARATDFEGAARAESDLSSVDHYVEMTMGSTPSLNYMGPAARFSNAAQTFYTGFGQFEAADLRISKVVAGARTDLATSGGYTNAVGDVMRITPNGSSLDLSINGVSQLSTTDTAITTGTRGGMWSYANGNCDADAWNASDLSVPAKAPPVFHRSTRFFTRRF